MTTTPDAAAGIGGRCDRPRVVHDREHDRGLAAAIVAAAIESATGRKRVSTDKLADAIATMLDSVNETGDPELTEAFTQFYMRLLTVQPQPTVPLPD